MTKNQIAYQTLLETKRSNLANEGIKSDTLTETQRHNKVAEHQGYIDQQTKRAAQQSSSFKDYVSPFTSLFKIKV